MKKIPEWARYRAVDADRNVHVFIVKPTYDAKTGRWENGTRMRIGYTTLPFVAERSLRILQGAACEHNTRH